VSPVDAKRRAGAVFAITLTALVALQACTPAPSSKPRAVAFSHVVYVMITDWHSGIVIARAEIEAVDRIPERDAFPDARFLEFGWGDRDYYPAPRPTLGLALGAAFASSASVMHLAAYDQLPRERYPAAQVFAIPLSQGALERLIAAIDASFERKESGIAEVIASGLYADSHFYPARGRFSLANTCNTWTARMLAESGADISPSGVVTASDLESGLKALPGIAGAP